MKRLVTLASLTVLLATGTANAALISMDDGVYGVGSITHDTISGLDWLDLTLSTGYSVNQVLGGSGGFLANGFNVATLEQVEAMYVSGGWDGVDDSPNSGSLAHAPFVSSLHALLGVTAVGGDGTALNEGFATTAVPGIASRPFNELTLAGNGRVACTTSGFNTFAAPVNAFSSCRMDYDQAYSFIGTFLVRDEAVPPVPEPSTLMLLASGVGAAVIAARRRSAK